MPKYVISYHRTISEEDLDSAILRFKAEVVKASESEFRIGTILDQSHIPACGYGMEEM